MRDKSDDTAPLALAITGLTFGVLHVLGGVDHLSAIAALSVGGRCEAFGLGVRWGVGHSVGLIMMTMLFLLMDINLDAWAPYCEGFVGVFMIVLGGVSAVRVWREPKPDTRESIVFVNEVELAALERNNDDDLSSRLIGQTQSKDEEATSSHGSEVGTNDCSKEEEAAKSGHHLPQSVMAVCVGIVHGIAGPGGILGVMPAVALHSWVKSSVYLGSFCGSSILVMGLFAASYGACTARCAGDSWRVRRCLSLFSAALAFAVGVLWLVLLRLGILEKVFG